LAFVTVTTAVVAGADTMGVSRLNWANEPSVFEGIVDVEIAWRLVRFRARLADACISVILILFDAVICVALFLFDG